MPSPAALQAAHEALPCIAFRAEDCRERPSCSNCREREAVAAIIDREVAAAAASIVAAARRWADEGGHLRDFANALERGEE